MKIRNPYLVRAIGWSGTRLVRLVAATLRSDYTFLGPLPTDPRRPSGQSFIYALWHEYFLMPVVRFGTPRLAALVSRHRDGELLCMLLRSVGVSCVRGSSYRGRVAALRGMLAAARNGQHLAITPDGPRGPRRHVQAGVIYLAARSGWPIVPVGVGFQHCWRLPSWDRFAIPRPFTRMRCIAGEPLHVPPHLRAADISAYCQLLRQHLNYLSALARLWARRGGASPPQLLPPPPRLVPPISHDLCRDHRCPRHQLGRRVRTAPIPIEWSAIELPRINAEPLG